MPEFFIAEGLSFSAFIFGCWVIVKFRLPAQIRELVSIYLIT